MNYRERMLRQMWRNDLAQKNQQWTQERNILQNDLTTLQNSTDIKILEDLNKEIIHLKKQIQALTLLAEDRKQRLAQEQSALLQLAQKKIANQKQAKELLTNLEQNWQQDRDTWDRERAELEEQHQTELTNLTQQIQDQTAKIQELNEWSQGQHNRILALESQEKNLTNDLNQSHQDLNLAQQEITNLKTQLTQSQTREQELNKITHQKEQRINYLETELEQANTKLTQTQQKASQDKQNQQTIINTLRTEKQAQQTQITTLTQELTQKTQTISQQLAQINQKNQKLTRQRTVLEQLLTNKEQRLQELEGGEND